MLTSDRVRVTNISEISPSPSNYVIPNHVKLSFFDTLWIFVSPIQRLLFYTTTNTPFHTISHTLKNSLSNALNHFYPLTGKLVFSQISSELEINLKDVTGVKYLEAESDYDFFELTRNDMHDMAGLLPELDISELPAPLLSVQVTKFDGGGIVVGVSTHHVAVDGTSFCQFLKSWAEMCRTGEELVGPIPSHDRSTFYGLDHQGLSKHFLNRLAPSLPELRNAGTQKNKVPNQVTRRTFIVNSINMDKLKERSTSNTSHGPAPVSKFVLLCAHLWICTTTARDVNLNSDTSLLFAMDVRSRLDPPMVEGYFGNCIRPCIVKAKAVELMGEDGFIFAVTTIKNAISVFSNEPLKECIDWADLYMTLPSELLCVGGSPRFKIYEADFGWGRPSRVEPASMSREGVVILSDARESGARQVSISLSPSQMTKFSSLFLDNM